MQLEFESARLTYRPLALSDLDLTIEQWTDPDVAKYTSGGTYTVAQLEDDMPRVTRRCAGGCIGVWVLTEKVSQEKLGTAILLPMPVELDDTDWDLVVGDNLPPGDVEIGYILKKSAWGKGYATEACQRLLRFAFEETPLQELVATIDPDNVASRHVLEKCGLRHLGLIRAYASDCPGFRITRDEWLARASAGGAIAAS